MGFDPFLVELLCALDRNPAGIDHKPGDTLAVIGRIAESRL
jgi:hypothetical protein